MSTDQHEKSLGKAIDEIVSALKGLNDASRVVALKAASDYLGLTVGPTLALGSTSSQIATVSTPGSSAAAVVTDIKSLKESKTPATAVEMACLVAYYLQELAPPSERKTEITTVEIDKYFRQGGYPLPKAQAQLLIDAKAAGYFDSPSRGTYKLNAVGYNLVAHRLPRAGGSAGTPKIRARKKAKMQRKGPGKRK